MYSPKQQGPYHRHRAIDKQVDWLIERHFPHYAIKSLWSIINYAQEALIGPENIDQEPMIGELLSDVKASFVKNDHRNCTINCSTYKRS